MNENKKSSVHNHMRPVLPAVASAIVWGAGQLMNKQYIKGIIFFLIQLSIMMTEFTTGNFGIPFSCRENGGFFVKGIWGIITLGTKPRELTLAGVTEGDHSIILMIRGIIVVLILFILIGIYIFNIRDAYQTRKMYNQTGYMVSTSEYIKKLWSTTFHYIVLLPAIILLIFLSIMPIVFSILTAFSNYSKVNMPPINLVKWVGMTNFANLFRIPVWSKTFFGVLGWTIVWAICSTVTCFFGGLFQAVIVNSRRVRAKRMWRGIYILPWAIPGMISLLVFRTMFNGQFGPVSQFLINMGITNERISWFTDPNNPNLARFMVILINLWMGFPYFMALMTGIMSGISNELYEAAKIDGATSWDELCKITLPLVLNAASPLLIMSFAGNFNNFSTIFFLTDGGPTNASYQFAGSTDILITWIFKLTVNNQLYNMAAVMSILIFIFIGGISIWNLRRTKAFKED